MPSPTTTQFGADLGTRPPGTPIIPTIAGIARVWTVGDSTLDGGANPAQGNSGLSWRQSVGEMLTMAGVPYLPVGRFGSPAPAWNKTEAIWGEKASEHYTRQNADGTILSTADPDVIVIASLGINDIQGGDTPAQARDSIQQLLDLYRVYTNGRGLSPRVVLGTLTGDKDQADQDKQDALNALFPALVTSQQALGQDILLCEAHHQVTTARLADGLHMNDRGYRLVGDAIFPVLMNALGRNAEWARPA